MLRTTFFLRWLPSRVQRDSRPPLYASFVAAFVTLFGCQPAPATAPLAINPAASQVCVGSNQTFTATGGRAPYTFSIQQGVGKIDAQTGVFSAPMTPGPTVVVVSDADGQISASDVLVRDLFVSPVTYPTAGQWPASSGLTSGDWNADGKTDLAVVNGGTDTDLTILLGKGAGAFLPAINYPGKSHAFSVTSGDWDGDGKVDLAIGYGSASDDVVVLRNDGDGGFASRASLDAGMRANTVIAGDWNRDGKADLAVTNGGPDVSLFLGTGNGTFGPPVRTVTGSGLNVLASGDWDGDGKTDFAVEGGPSGNSVIVLRGRGDGTFAQTGDFVAGFGAVSSIAAADFNGDGKLDLAAPTQDTYFNGNFNVLLGGGDGTFRPPKQTFVDRVPQRLVAGDWNGDGIIDVAMTGAGGGPFGDLLVLLGVGDGSFRSAPPYQPGQSAQAMIVGDWNGDGRSDLAIANLGGVLVLMNSSCAGGSH